MSDSMQVDDSIQRYDISIRPWGYEGGYETVYDTEPDGTWVRYDDHLKAIQAAVQEAILEERETCALVCARARKEWGSKLQDGEAFAALIRGD